MRLDPARHEMTRDDVPTRMTRKEFAVLAELLLADGAVVSAESLLHRAWDEHMDPFTNVVRVTMTALRRKLGHPHHLIQTITGVGYRIRGTSPASGHGQQPWKCLSADQPVFAHVRGCAGVKPANCPARAPSSHVVNRAAPWGHVWMPSELRSAWPSLICW